MPEDQTPRDPDTPRDPYEVPDAEEIRSHPAGSVPASVAAPAKRPTAWMVATAILGVAVIGLLVWAMSLKSDRDDAEAASSAQVAALQEQVADLEKKVVTQQAAGEDIVAAAKARLDAARQRFQGVQSELGATSQALAASVSQLEQLKTDATAAVGQAGTAAQSEKARAELAEACLKAVADILERAYASDDPASALEGAASELEQIAPNCAPAG